MFLIRRCILKKPDVEDFLGIVREEVLLKPVDSPLDRFFRMLLHDFWGFITDNDERSLNNYRELRRRQFLLELLNVPGKISFGESAGG